MSRQHSGQLAEQRACQFLQRQGLRLLERNWRCRLGELDLIMRDDDHLVFITTDASLLTYEARLVRVEGSANTSVPALAIAMALPAPKAAASPCRKRR